MQKIRASSLSYAILFLLFIGLFTSGIILVSGSHKLIEVHSRIKENVIFNTYNNLNSALLGDYTDETKINYSGDTSKVFKSAWGAWEVIHCKSYSGRYKYEKFAFVGTQNKQEKIALYLVDTDQKLFISGETKIEGTSYLPKRGIDRAYVANKSYSGKKLLYGKQLVSKKTLPELNKKASNFKLSELLQGESVTKIDHLPGTTYQKFSDPIVLYQSLTPIYLEDTIKGRVIIYSYDSIYVSNKSLLKNVMLVAPIVRIEQGFKGSVQIESSNRVTIEKNAQLEYPSTIRLLEAEKNTSDVLHGVYFDEGSSLHGGVLILTKKPNFRNLVELKITEDALITGLIYNQGKSNVKGSIVGSLYTYKIELKTKSANYSNHLLDAYISSRELPDYYVFPNWLMGTGESKKHIIDWL